MPLDDSLLDKIIPDDEDIITTTSRGFTDEYKEECFLIWYQAGKPSSVDLMKRIPFPKTNMGNKPTMLTLRNWITDMFTDRGREMDEEVKVAMTESMVKTKVEMLKKHIEVGQEMQHLALDWMRDHKDELTASASVRLLVEGLRIERESVGIPEMFEKMQDKSDQELLEEVQKLIEKGDVTIESIDDGDE